MEAECAFECRNWRDAPEEHDFVTDAQGQRHHPVHAAELLAAQAAAVAVAPPLLFHYSAPGKRRRVSLLETVVVPHNHLTAEPLPIVAQSPIPVSAELLAVQAAAVAVMPPPLFHYSAPGKRR